MFDRALDAGAFVGSVFQRHGRVILMWVAAVVIVGGLVQGAFAPGPFDLGVLAALIVRRFGFVRTTVTGSMLVMLAIAAMPRTGCTRQMAYGAAMKSDLKNLASQQEIYYSDQYAYTTSATELAFTHSDGVQVTLYATQQGWAAWATHAALGPSEGCAIYYGESPVRLEMIGEVTPTHPGEVVCTK